jgi:hypothetical protein
LSYIIEKAKKKRKFDEKAERRMDRDLSRQASPDMVGEMELSLNEHGGHWKSGLVIKGIAIRPQY